MIQSLRGARALHQRGADGHRSCIRLLLLQTKGVAELLLEEAAQIDGFYSFPVVYGLPRELEKTRSVGL